MTFTGRIGTVQSQLGNIVLGVVDSFGLGTFGFEVHVLGPRRVRVLFSRPVTDSALQLPGYSLSTTAPSTSVLPTIQVSKFYDETRRSVVLHLSQSLTSGVTYSLQCAGIGSVDGLGISPAARNFVANAPDPPRALGAWQSTRGCVDIRFDRTVGAYSGSATAKVRDASAAVGTGVSMTQLAWAGQANLPADTLRFSYPPGIASANSYAIDLVGVTDSSLNVSSPTVPLTLALRSPLPYDYAKLRQVQIVDAVVSDVSSDFLQGGMVRVFFNCPTNNPSAASWTLTQAGPHPVAAAAQAVVSPDAVDLASLLTLVNEVKAKVNAHLVAEQVHLRDATADTVTSPTAIDLTTANVMIDEIQVDYASHLARAGVHLYQDVLNTVGFIAMQPGNLALAISMTNALKAKFNGHLASEFPVSIISTFQDVAALSYYDSPIGGTCHSVISPFCLYAELIYNKQASPGARIFVKVTASSDDLGSTTNPLDYTGSIEARAASAPALAVHTSSSVDGPVEVEADRELDVSGVPPLELSGPGGKVVASVSRTSTLAHVRWLLKQLVTAYRWHIDPGSGAGHAAVISNWIIGSEGLPAPDLANLIEKANYVRTNLAGHMSSETDHFQRDPAVDALSKAPVATDFETLVVLMSALRDAFVAHSPAIGPHSSPGYRIVSAPLMTVLRVQASGIVDESTMRLSGQVRTRFRDNLFGGGARPLGDDRYGSLSLDLQFRGVATRPSVASAVARSGVVQSDSGPSFESDAVEVFFTRPMYQVPLSASNLAVTGGSLLQKDASWSAPDVAVVRVSNMQAVSYTVTATGLTDPAGNPVL